MTQDVEEFEFDCMVGLKLSLRDGHVHMDFCDDFTELSVPLNLIEALELANELLDFAASLDREQD